MTEDMTIIAEEAYLAAKEILEKARLEQGELFVVGCSTSEVGGATIGTYSSPELAEVGLELFRRNYHWERPIRSIGLRGAGLVEAVGTVQMSLYAEDQRRDKWERIDRAVDYLRRRYGYMSVRRALLDTDPRLGHINVRDDHTVHPVGYFGG